eukprot:CAMPEP_0183711824 /NCGR_PEP_ID=MMETSP0737-20130205/7201_1 /TAXON_ID=385413 /ORGANISM="Thalassiosira miniscula, Strain CCMP1093" /LENGTH=1113 /DNA_ID=CAMNT_0025940391 /DNA_START=66 /DNA_END=3407 /DNA_ORIENTATION=+
MAQPPPQYSYTPPPNELPYYNALFSAADKSSSGYLMGPPAVEFLSLSKLPVDLLKQIWTMADQPASNTLDPKKFFVAVRLIQLFQNAKKPVDLALNLAEGEGVGVRPPFFEGVNVQQIMQQQMQQAQQQQGGMPPQPPQQQPQQQRPSMATQQPPQQPVMQQQQPPQPSPTLQPAQQPSPVMQPSPQQSPKPQGMGIMNGGHLPPSQGAQPATPTTLAVQDPYSITPQELARYEQLFPQYAQPDDPNNPASPRFVHGAAAVELFSKSGMDRENLRAIWTMVDDPIDNKLDPLEFSVAMHLIVCITKKGLSMPAGGLPGSLARTVREMREKQQQPQGGQAASLPSPEKQPGMGTQQPSMNGGMMSPPMQQQQQQAQPQMAQMGAPGIQGQMPQTQMGGMSQIGGGDSVVGGHTVDDAFAGLSNDPVPSVDDYSTVGGIGGGGMSDGMSTMGGMSGMGAMGNDASNMAGMSGGMSTMGSLGGARQAQQQEQQQQPIVEMATSEPSPKLAPTMPSKAAMPTPPMQTETQPQQQQAHTSMAQLQPQQTQAQPKSTPAVSKGGDSSAELTQLREAHQKLQAEVISLRAKAATVTDEEQENQKEIATLASDIAKLSLELSELKSTVAESKVKLAESVGVLKMQMEKKESLEAQVAEARETQEALTSATEAIDHANEFAMSQQAKAVAVAAGFKEEAESVIPPPAPVQTGDLFGWDAPAPAPTPAAPASDVPAPAMQQDAMPAWGQEAQQPVPQPNSEDKLPAWGAPSDAASVQGSVHNDTAVRDTFGSFDGASVSAHSVQKEDGHRGSIDSMGDRGTGMSMNPNPYGGFQGIPDPMGGGGGNADLFGAPLGGQIGGGSAAWGAPSSQQQQPMMNTPMGGSSQVSEWDSQSVTSHSVAPSVAPSVAQTPMAAHTPTRNDFNSAAPAQVPPPHPPSPSKKELESLKSETQRAEKSFQTSLSLVRSISTEVSNLESVAKKAEIDMKTLETKKKKGSFGGKKKAKKEYEKAVEIANGEKRKVSDAREQLAAAERESDKAKKQMEECRHKFEQAELEAATAASYLSVQQSNNSSMTSAQTSDKGYSDPFGMGQPVPSNSSSADPYGMGGVMGGGGGDYANPFAM